MNDDKSFGCEQLTVKQALKELTAFLLVLAIMAFSLFFCQ
jgi:hypothetical protein